MNSENKFDVLLTYPKENINAFYYMIPLGIAGIAAVLEQNGFSVKVIDFNFYHHDFRRYLKKWSPKIIGIGGTTGTRNGSFKTAKICKEILPEVSVVYGGPHATFTAEDTLQNIKEIDFIVKNEGEFPFLNMAEKFVRNKNIFLKNIYGISYRKEAEILHNPVTRIENLDILPLPARHLFEGKYKIKLDYLGLDADFLITSRGCPFSCDFCSAAKMFPAGIRFRSMEHIQKEIDFILSKKKIKALKIFDSTFTASKKHVIDFCRMIKPYNLFWECEVRADTVDLNLLKTMKEAGCSYIDIGLETTDRKMLDSINKKISVQQVENVIGWCREIGIKIKVFFTFGHLDQTYQSCLNDVSYIKRNKDKIDFFATTVGMRIYPGTSLFTKAKSSGLIPQDFSWVKFKAPPWKFLLFEFENQFILNQKQLNYWKLLFIVIKLVSNGTVGSIGFIKELLVINCHKLAKQFGIRFKFLYHIIRRKVRGL